MSNGNCSENIATFTTSALYCGVSFLFIGVYVLGISVLVTICFGKGKDSANSNSVSSKNGSYVHPTQQAARMDLIHLNSSPIPVLHENTTQITMVTY